MCKLIIFSIFAYGLSNLLVYGTGPWQMLSKFREFAEKRLGTIGEMLKCMMCTSTNIGWLLSLFNIIFLPCVALTPLNAILTPNNFMMKVIIIFGDACFTSGVVWLLHTVQETFERAFTYGD